MHRPHGFVAEGGVLWRATDAAVHVRKARAHSAGALNAHFRAVTAAARANDTTGLFALLLRCGDMPRDAAAEALLHGSEETFAMLRRHGAHIDGRCLAHAAGHGLLATVTLLHAHAMHDPDRGNDTQSAGLPLTAEAMAAAARGGHVHVMKWLRAHGCPWDADTLDAATEAGQHATLMWALDNGCPEHPRWDPTGRVQVAFSAPPLSTPCGRDHDRDVSPPHRRHRPHTHSRRRHSPTGKPTPAGFPAVAAPPVLATRSLPSRMRTMSYMAAPCPRPHTPLPEAENEIGDADDADADDADADADASLPSLSSSSSSSDYSDSDSDDDSDGDGDDAFVLRVAQTTVLGENQTFEEELAAAQRYADELKSS